MLVTRVGVSPSAWARHGARRALPCLAGMERAEEGCGGRTFPSHPSCWLLPSPGAARRPESPKTPRAVASPQCRSVARPGRTVSPLLSAPTRAAGAAEPMARPHGAMRFGDRSGLFCLHRAQPGQGSGLLGKLESACPCHATIAV